MYVRNCWYVAAWSDELGQSDFISRTILNHGVLLYRARDGRLVGLQDRCCHRYAPLSRGRREDDDIRCMYHGLRYDRNGICNDIPGQRLIPPKARVRTFPVIERHSWIWVWMGDQARADPALIPQAVGLDDPRYTLRHGQMDYKASYLLICDNLTDFSHLPYVHASSFGSGEEWSRQHSVAGRIPRGIRVQRWLPATTYGRAATAENDQAAPGRPESFDGWTSYDFLVPGVLLMYNASFPGGSAAASQFRPPAADLRPLVESFTSQAVTPMTDTATRYFYSWGPGVGAGSDAIADQMLELANMAFAEDRAIIEAQQAVIDREHPSSQVLTAHDRGPSLMRRVFEDLVARESAPAQMPQTSESEA